MDEQLTMAAKTLARWCYARGVDERVLGVGEQLLKAAADQARGRTASAHLEQRCGNRPPRCCVSDATGTVTTR